jgi:hypothetical protein
MNTKRYVAPPVSSLSDLAQKCTELEALMGLEEWTYDIFSGVQRRLNNLQHSCPAEESIFQARVEWYERGLKNFQKCIPMILRNPSSNPYHRVEGQIMDLYTMKFFLRRSYFTLPLQSEFPRLFKEVIIICTKTIRAANQRNQSDFAKTMLDLRTQLENSLLEGRL